MELLTNALINLGLGTPVYLVLIVGIILAALRLREAPTRYGLVLASLALHLTVGMGVPVLQTVLQSVMIQRAEPASSFAWVFGVVGLVSTLIQAVAWLLLLAALFWRRSLERPTPENRTPEPLGLSPGPSAERRP